MVKPKYCMVAVATVAAAGYCDLSASAQQFRHQTTVRFPQPSPLEYTNQLTIGDLNGNGHLDIVFANGGNYTTPGPPQTLRLYMNNGTGFFTDESVARTGGLAGIFRHAELGDVNRNGHLDMILAADFNTQPRLLINDGDGFFTDETAARLPQQTLSSSRAQFFDLNNNGHLDLYLTNGGLTNRFGCGPSKIYMNDGNGFYTDETALRHPPGNICQPMDAKIADLTGDFNLDVRVAGRGNNTSKLFYNNGEGILVDVSSNVPPDHFAYSYEVADINNNGRLDMVGINAVPGSLATLLLRNEGNGTFANISNQISPNPSVDDNDAVFIDFNNNGHFDLVIARLGGVSERFYQNDGNGNFTEVLNMISPISDATLDIKAGDLTGDGRLDIVTGQGEFGDYTNRIYINTGPADTIPPKIVKTEQIENTDDTVGPYVVRADISDSMTSDRNFFDKGIHINYSVNGGAVEQVPMLWSGGQIYRAEIPGVSGGTVEYFVTAIDFAGNLGTGPTLSFEVAPQTKPGDLSGPDGVPDGIVDVFDLIELINNWGPCADVRDCPADLSGPDGEPDGEVDVFDLIELINNWG